MSYMKDFLEDVRVMTLQGCSAEYIASCHDMPVEQVEAAIEMLMEDEDFRATVGDFDEPHEPDYDDDSDDGDIHHRAWRDGRGDNEDYVGHYGSEW